MKDITLSIIAILWSVFLFLFSLPIILMSVLILSKHIRNYKGFLASIFIMFSMISCKVFPIREVVIREVCDSTAINQYIENKLEESGKMNKIGSDYYRNIYHQQANGIHCKNVKMIDYKKNNKIIKTVRCSEATNKKDLNLCK